MLDKEIIYFLQKSILPEDKIKARRMRMKDARFFIVRVTLYMKFFFQTIVEVHFEGRGE